MAIAALSSSAPFQTAADVAGIRSEHVAVFKYTPPVSYTTNGEAIDFHGTFPGLVPSVPLYVRSYPLSGTIGWQATWNPSNNKIQLWNGTTEFGNGSDASGKLFVFEVVCA